MKLSKVNKFYFSLLNSTIIFTFYIKKRCFIEYSFLKSYIIILYKSNFIYPLNKNLLDNNIFMFFCFFLFYLSITTILVNRIYEFDNILNVSNYIFFRLF